MKDHDTMILNNLSKDKILIRGIQSGHKNFNKDNNVVLLRWENPI